MLTVVTNVLNMTASISSTDVSASANLSPDWQLPVMIARTSVLNLTAMVIIARH